MPKLFRKTKFNYAFIDSQNLNLGIQAQGWKLDWRKFKAYLQAEHNVSKAYLFIGYLEEQEDMYTKLREMGYTLILKPTVMHNEEVKGNVDVDLVLQTMADWKHYQKAVIVSGDGDFLSLVKHLLDNRKLQALVIPNQRRYSQLFNDLPEGCVHFMSGMRSDLSYGNVRRNNNGKNHYHRNRKSRTPKKPGPNA